MSYVQTLYVHKNAEINGNLTVNGTTTSIDSEVVNIADNFLYLNNGYATSGAAQSGGIIVNYDPTATADAAAAGGFTTTTTVTTAGAATFAAGDIIQVSDANTVANEGVYEVVTHAANVLTISATPATSFAQAAFTVDTDDAAAVITKINVAVMQTNTSGVWQTTYGADVTAINTTNLETLATTGGPASFANIALSDETNQITMGTTGVATISAEVTSDATFTIPNGTASDTFVFRDTTDTLTNKTLTAPIIDEINDANGNELVIFNTTASAVNEFTMTNAATGTAPILSASGEADTGMEIHDSNGNELLLLNSTAAAVNELTITNQITGVNASITGTGETDAGIDLIASGAGVVSVSSASATDSGILRILNDAGDAGVSVTVPAALAADYTLTLPADDGDAGFALTTDGNGVTSWTSVAVGIPTLAAVLASGNVTGGTDIDVNGTDIIDMTTAANVLRFSRTLAVDVDALTQTTGAGVAQIPDLGGTTDQFVMEDVAQTLTNKTFTLPEINDTSADHQYVFGVSELTANRTVTLPLLTADDEFTFNDHTQTLTNKTLELPTITAAAGEEVLLFADAGTAVNEFTITNAATGSGPILEATGDDADIDVNITPKGDGVINLNGPVNIEAEAVKKYTVAGPHVLGTDGLRVNIVTHAATENVTLPTDPTDGTIYTIINDGTVSAGSADHLIITAGGTNTIDDDTDTFITLFKRWQRVTLQFVADASNGIWYIV